MFNKNQPLITVVLGLIFFIIDRVIKYLFINNLVSNNFLFSYTKNSGIVFGIQLPGVFLILFYIVITLIFIALIIWFIESWTGGKHFEASLIWLIIIGSASNIIDRIRFGFVIDYINLHFWPVFNIADSLIVIGVLMLLLKYIKKDKKIEKSEEK